jgi:Domain of unknown function (DUF5063)
MSKAKNPLYSKEILEFVVACRDFCIFIEQADKPDIKKFIDDSHKLLPLLYLKATVLPTLDSKYEDFNERFVTEKDYELVHRNILTKLGQYDAYEEVFDPGRKESIEPIGASISENLADIYQDLKDFILLYEIGSDEVMYEAVWACKQSFEIYWGQRLTNALRALHFLRYSEEIDEEEMNHPKDELNIDDIDTSDWIISRRLEDLHNEE